MRVIPKKVTLKAVLYKTGGSAIRDLYNIVMVVVMYIFTYFDSS